MPPLYEAQEAFAQQWPQQTDNNLSGCTTAVHSLAPDASGVPDNNRPRRRTASRVVVAPPASVSVLRLDGLRVASVR